MLQVPFLQVPNFDMETRIHLQNLKLAVAEACTEIQNCPEDSIQDIFNERLEFWNLPWRMNYRFKLVDEPLEDD